MRRSLFGRRGGSAIEFALTLPVLVTMFAAIIEYGWFFLQQQAVLSGARDGVRYGVKIAQEADPATEAETRAELVIEGFGLDCSDPVDCQINATILVDDYDYLRIDLDYAYDPLMSGLLPTPEFVRADFTMALEDQS